MLRWILPALAVGVGLTARRIVRQMSEADLSGQVVLITGGSRGLGLALAREFARQGCRVAICARDESELDRALQGLRSSGADAAAFTCDVTDRAAVDRLVADVTARFGAIDVLVANAGEIMVGPLETMTVEDFQHAMDIMFWGAAYASLAVLPQMRTRHAGRIAIISSIGGKVSVPHLLPYDSAKFAAQGFAEGLRAEVAHEGITVTAVAPGLMRTGSHINASFKGQHRREYGWFSLGASLPVTSIAADDAARQIVTAIKRGEAEVVLTWQAKLLALAHGVFPGFVIDTLAVVNRVLPSPGGLGTATATGRASTTPLTESSIEGQGHDAAAEYNQR